MNNYLKKILSTSVLLFVVSQSFAQEGYECYMPYAQVANEDTEFICRDNDAIKGRITIKEIYEKNYRVVATFVAHKIPKIIIEKQD